MNQELLNTIDNSIDSILWINSQDFQNSSKYFTEFNYLMSGVLEEKIKNLEGLYQTESFNKTLNIALIKKGPQQSSIEASTSILSIFNKSSSSKILLVHDGVEENLISKFSKKFKNQNFIEFPSLNENEDA